MVTPRYMIFLKKSNGIPSLHIPKICLLVQGPRETGRLFAQMVLEKREGVTSKHLSGHFQMHIDKSLNKIYLKSSTCF